MSAAKHTPGPWQAVSASVCSEVEMMEIAEVAHMRVVPRGGGWPTPGAPEDDARLIAAAPELLEALIAVSKQARHSDYDWDVSLSREVSAAIAKATGGEA